MSISHPRIIFLQNQLDDLGGVSKFTGLLAAGLIDRGYPVEVGAITNAVGESGNHYRSDVKTWVLSSKPHKPDSGLLRLRRRAMLHAARTNFEEQVRTQALRRFATYDEQTIVVFTQLHARELIGPVALMPRRFRVISQYHSSFAAASAGRDLERALREYKDDDLFTCLSEEDAMQFQRAGLNNAGFVLNPVDVPKGLQPSPLSNRVAVSLSRYDPIKQVDHMVKAWALIQDRIPEWQLKLYGSGPDEESLKHVIEEEGVGHSVTLMGPTDNAHDVLRECSISLNSSLHEGFGLAVAEASAHGVPNVVYACSPGILEIVEDGVTGITAPPGDITSFAQGILDLALDPQLRNQLGKAGRDHVTRKFALGGILDEWEKIFAGVLR